MGYLGFSLQSSFAVRHVCHYWRHFEKSFITLKFTCPMASPLPSVLIAGHSFVKRLHSDLQCKFDLRAAVDFNLVQIATVSFHGIGGLTVPRLARELRLLFVNEPLPRVIILEIGTNDLSSKSPEVVIGEVLDLVDYLQSVESSTVVGVCKVIPRRQRGTGLPLEDFNNRRVLMGVPSYQLTTNFSANCQLTTNFS